MSSAPAVQPDEVTRRIEAALGTAYTLRRELGAGMSRVFVAEERALGRRVVLKVLAGELPAAGAADRFRREILLCAQLQHPHIVPVLGAGELDGIPYFVMPFIDGESLRSRFERGGRIGLQEAQRILRDVAAALAHAHSHGVVHRDIKPENILLSGGIAIVADFGVAKALGGGGSGGETERDAGAGTVDDAITSAGFSVGTPAYMAPEQAVGDPSTDHRADIYAFGVLAYELLAGRTPFGHRSTIAMLRAHAVEPVPPLRDQRREVPPVLAELVERCLEKQPNDRPRTALEIIRVLESGAVRRAGARHRGPVRRAARVAAVLAGTAVLISTAVRKAGMTGSGAPEVSVAFEGVAAGGGDPTLAAIFAEVVREQTGTPFRLVPPTRRAAITIIAAVETRPDGYAFSLRALDRPSGDLLVAVRETAPDRASAMAAMARSHARFERWLREAL